jgi:hypothetical protein
LKAVPEGRQLIVVSTTPLVGTDARLCFRKAGGEIVGEGSERRVLSLVAAVAVECEDQGDDGAPLKEIT